MQSVSVLPFMWIYRNNPPSSFFNKRYLRCFLSKCIFAIMESVPCSSIMHFRISRKFTWPFGLCVALLGIWRQMKHSCWHQNRRVRNICALSVSWQIGHCGDGGIDYSDVRLPGSRKPSWNKQFSFLLCDGWMKRWWLYWWLEGVSQTTEQKEKHGEEKQSHLTS